MLLKRGLLSLAAFVPIRRVHAARSYAYGPPDLQEVCAAGICHRFGKIAAPLDHADPSAGEWELTYFVNSDYWNPLGEDPIQLIGYAITHCHEHILSPRYMIIHIGHTHCR